MEQVSHTRLTFGYERDRGRTTDCRFRLDPRTVLDPQTFSIPRQFDSERLVSAARIRPLAPTRSVGTSREFLRAGRTRRSTPPSPAVPGARYPKQEQAKLTKLTKQERNRKSEKSLREFPPNDNSPSSIEWRTPSLDQQQRAQQQHHPSQFQTSPSPPRPGSGSGSGTGSCHHHRHIQGWTASGGSQPKINKKKPELMKQTKHQSKKTTPVRQSRPVHPKSGSTTRVKPSDVTSLSGEASPGCREAGVVLVFHAMIEPPAVFR